MAPTANACGRSQVGSEGTERVRATPGASQEYSPGYSTGTQPGGMYGQPGNGSGLWGWGDTFRNLQSDDPQKKAAAQQRLWFMLGYAGSPGGNPAQPFADLAAQQQKNQIGYTAAIAQNRVPATPGGNAPAAQIRGWNPALIAQLIEQLSRAGRG
jgi:hypothetical protein